MGDPHNLIFSGEDTDTAGDAPASTRQAVTMVVAVAARVRRFLLERAG